MRIIGGEFRSRKLKPVPGYDTRPTPDRLREALFNVIAPRLEGVVFVDAYAGTGAVGLEALSRGAARVVLIEWARPALRVLRENVALLGVADRAEIVAGHPARELRSIAADIVFLDPPYEKTKEYEGSLGALGEAAPALVIAQHSSRYDPGGAHGRLRRYRTLQQGDNSLSFYAPE